MPKFTYKVKDAKDKILTGSIEAPDSNFVAKSLKNQGYFIIDIHSANANLGFAKSFSSLKKITQSDLTNFTRQLAVMLTTGLTLTEAISILRAQTSNPPMEKLLNDVISAVEGGSTFSKALSARPDVFSSTYVSVVKSGESSGLLDKMLNRLADNLEQEREFQGKTKGALIYPLIIVIGMVIVITIMMIFVIPQLSSLYTQLGVDLPLPTLIVIAISNFFVNFWYIILAVVLGGIIAFRAWKQTEGGRFALDALQLKLPVFGALQENINLTEITRTFGLLAGSGMPVIDALTNVGNGAQNALFREATVRVAKKIEKGLSVGNAFAREPIFPPLVAQMARVGEETGKIDDVMLKTSNYYEQEAERIIKSLTTLLEPIILVVLGLGIGFLIISVILPIYNLTSAIK